MPFPENRHTGKLYTCKLDGGSSELSLVRLIGSRSASVVLERGPPNKPVDGMVEQWYQQLMAEKLRSLMRLLPLTSHVSRLTPHAFWLWEQHQNENASPTFTNVQPRPKKILAHPLAHYHLRPYSRAFSPMQKCQMGDPDVSSRCESGCCFMQPILGLKSVAADSST
jgi:hypothetical protein